MGESALRYLIGAQKCVGEQSETAIEAQFAFWNQEKILKSVTLFKLYIKILFSSELEQS